MRSTSAEARRACRHQPWLTRTPRCGLRTRPLRTVRPGAQGSYCTGLGRSMPAWVGRAVPTATLVPATLVPGGNRPYPPMRLGTTGHQAASTALQRPCHHVEQWLRAALTRTSRSLRTAHTGYVYQPILRAYAPKAQGSLPRCPTHCTYAARVPTSGVPYAPRTAYRGTHYRLRV